MRKEKKVNYQYTYNWTVNIHTPKVLRYRSGQDAIAELVLVVAHTCTTWAFLTNIWHSWAHHKPAVSQLAFRCPRQAHVQLAEPKNNMSEEARERGICGSSRIGRSLPPRMLTYSIATPPTQSQSCYWRKLSRIFIHGLHSRSSAQKLMQ
jgi:hypothetical protein